MLIHESSELDDSTDHDGQLDQENVPDVQNYAAKIYISKKKVDQTFVQLYETKCKHEKRNRFDNSQQQQYEIESFGIKEEPPADDLVVQSQGNERQILDIQD